VLREDAYRWVQRNAMQAWREGKNFREMIFADPEITARVAKKTLERAFDLNRQLRNVDRIFRRVFPGGTPPVATSPGRKTTKRKPGTRKAR